MSLILAFLYALAGGVLWRIRGGAWETLLRLPPGTTVARLATSAGFALLLLPAIGPWALALWAALYLGTALAGWGDAMDIGRVAGSRWLDAAAMSGWGLVATGPAFVLAVVLGWAWWPIPLAGLAFGPIYAFAWHLDDYALLPHRPRFAVGPTEWAEAAVGAAIAAALFVAVS